AEIRLALKRGDIEILNQQLSGCVIPDRRELERVLRALRSVRSSAALYATNLVAYIRLARSLVRQAEQFLEARLIAVLAGAGGGNTQLAAQLTAANPARPAGILLHGRDLGATQSIDVLANGIAIHGM